MIRLVMLGGPGSGKGTQAHKIAQDLKIPVISTGDILKKAIADNTPLGNEAQEYLHKGDLVPDEIMIKFMKERLMQPDTEAGWILEGYPRTAFQAEELDFLLDELEKKLDWAIYLKVDEKVMIERSLKRNQVDDKPEIINRRIESFHKETVPILDYYSFKKKLLTIEAEGTIQEVENKVLSHFPDIKY